MCWTRQFRLICLAKEQQQLHLLLPIPRRVVSEISVSRGICPLNSPAGTQTVAQSVRNLLDDFAEAFERSPRASCSCYGGAVDNTPQSGQAAASGPIASTTQPCAPFSTWQSAKEARSGSSSLSFKVFAIIPR